MLWWTLSLACVRGADPVSEPVVAPTEAAQGWPEGWLERVVGAEPDAELPMVVFLHGRGDKPESMLSLLEDLPGPVRIVAPRGGVAFRDGWAWYPIAGGAAAPDVLTQHMAEQANAFVASLARAVEARPTVGKPILGGFSQGGMMSFAVATAHPEAISRAVPVGGTLPEPLWPLLAPDGAPPIRALHGDNDVIVRIGPTRDAVEALRAQRWDATLLEFQGVGHSIPPHMREKLLEMLAP